MHLAMRAGVLVHSLRTYARRHGLAVVADACHGDRIRPTPSLVVQSTRLDQMVGRLLMAAVRLRAVVGLQSATPSCKTLGRARLGRQGVGLATVLGTRRLITRAESGL